MTMSRLVLLNSAFVKEEVCERNNWMDLSNDKSYPAIDCVRDTISQHVWGIPMSHIPASVTEKEMKIIAVARGAVKNFTGAKVAGIMPATNMTEKVVLSAIGEANFLITNIGDKFWMKVK